VNPFTYLRAGDPDGAIAAVAAEPRAAFLAGGTTLVDLLRLHVETPEILVDIAALPLSDIRPLPDGGVRIGALARNSDVATNPWIRGRMPVLAEAVAAGASPQLRNMATVGGNLMQRTRCPYFRDVAVSACNKRVPGSGCAALDGYTRMHALLGTTDRCIATHPSDMAVALAALDAVVRTRRPGGGDRAIPFEEFHVPYGADPVREHVLEGGELITAVEVPGTAWFGRSRYVKIRDRASFDFALASAAVALDLAGGTIRAARVALGGIATKPWRSVEAERVLADRPAGEDVFREAADAALRGARPRRHNAFKIDLAKRTLVRALALAAA
jgi:xanthine dehydrogenase YagS FAD-binding subunit